MVSEGSRTTEEGRLQPGLDVEEDVGKDEHAHSQPDDIVMGDDAAAQNGGVTDGFARIGGVCCELALPPRRLDCSTSHTMSCGSYDSQSGELRWSTSKVASDKAQAGQLRQLRVAGPWRLAGS